MQLVKLKVGIVGIVGVVGIVGAVTQGSPPCNLWISDWLLLLRLLFNCTACDDDE